MTEEEAVFDPSMKKKKKKKKTPFEMNEDEAAGGTAAPVEEKVAEAPVVPAVVEVASPPEEHEKADAEKDGEGGDVEDMESFGKKKKKTGKKVTLSTPEDDAAAVADIDLDTFGKKKKKKKVREGINMDDVEEALPKEDEGPEEDELDFTKMKKSGKKKRDMQALEEDKENEKASPTSENAYELDQERDYTFDELLNRVFKIMQDKNPEVVAGEKKKFVMRPPQVVRVGTKKTAFVNFTEIAKMLHRNHKHLSDFLWAELGTAGAVDGNNQLIMKGRFQQKHIENVLRRYIKEYVTCHTCRSPDTILNKEARLFFLQCMTCQSKCSVQTIKTGFQAVTGKRSAIRAKQ